MSDTAPPPDPGAPPADSGGWLHRHRVEVAWAAFAVANYAVMIAVPSWETVPFHFVWISLTLLYGFRVWPLRGTLITLGAVMTATAVSIAVDAFRGIQLWGELMEVPLMAAMFLAMVWHARRRVDALRVAEQRAEQGRSLLDRQERFVHDASHELRTPVTIARGHLELLRAEGIRRTEIDVALDELASIDAITKRLLLLATVDQPDFVRPVATDLEPLLEEVFMRWCDVAPRAWRLGPLVAGSLVVDPERLRVALDALIENAVKYTEPAVQIELSARRTGVDAVSIEVRDQGCGVPEDARARIFDRFARADTARTRATGGVGLGLAIVDAIAKAHGGSCSVASNHGGAAFALHLPHFTAAAALLPEQPATTAVAAPGPSGSDAPFEGVSGFSRF